jgi:hypothetical protein
MKMSLKLKINPIREYLGYIIYPIKPSAGLFFLLKSRETIPLREVFFLCKYMGDSYDLKGNLAVKHCLSITMKE